MQSGFFRYISKIIQDIKKCFLYKNFVSLISLFNYINEIIFSKIFEKDFFSNLLNFIQLYICLLF